MDTALTAAQADLAELRAALLDLQAAQVRVHLEAALAHEQALESHALAIAALLADADYGDVLDTIRGLGSHRWQPPHTTVDPEQLAGLRQSWRGTQARRRAR